jgi:uridine kinase
MIVVFVCGMPASGKSTVAKGLTNIFTRFFHLIDSHLLAPYIEHIEGSDVVKEWITHNLGGNVSILDTPIGSKQLYDKMWRRITSNDVSIISGIRETYLLRYTDPNIRSYVIYLDVPRYIREKRYSLTSRQYSFKEAEERAILLGTPDIKQEADRIISIPLSDHHYRFSYPDLTGQILSHILDKEEKSIEAHVHPIHS